MADVKKVLIVCYSFPPNAGVGGRKWAKTAKYLLKIGWEVHILMKQPAIQDNSPWTADTKGCIVHSIIPHYPEIISREPEEIIEKIWYRLALLRLKFITSSNYYDRAVLLENDFGRKLMDIIHCHQINNLIVTGAPFSLLYYAAKEKVNHPELKFIADIRDSWLSENFYGFGLLSNKRREIEKQRLIEVLNTADKTFVPYETMLNEYQKLGTTDSAIEVLPHAVDDAMILPRRKQMGISLVHFGSHYHNLNGIFSELAVCLQEQTEIKLNFYTKDFKYKNIFEAMDVLNVNCIYNNIVAENRVFEILSESTAAVLFTPDYMKDFISTKYLENAAARIPMIVIGKKGIAADFVINNRLGIFISENEIVEKLPEITELIDKLDYNENFDINPFLFSKQAEKIAELLNK